MQSFFQVLVYIYFHFQYIRICKEFNFKKQIILWFLLNIHDNQFFSTNKISWNEKSIYTLSKTPTYGLKWWRVCLKCLSTKSPCMLICNECILLKHSRLSHQHKNSPKIKTLIFNLNHCLVQHVSFFFFFSFLLKRMLVFQE